MKKPKDWSQPTRRVHESREDRARTWSGKTASRKIRNEGRHLAALERSAVVRHACQAAAARADWTKPAADRTGRTEESSRPAG